MSEPTKKVPGTEEPAPTYVESATAEAIERFAKAIPPEVDDNEVLFGRAPLETRVTVGMLRDDREGLRDAAHAYCKDIKKSLHDEYVVKSYRGYHITVGDLRDYADKNPLPGAKK